MAVELSTPDPTDTKRITISKESDTDSTDQLDAIDMQQVKCYDSGKRGHFAKDCKRKRNSFSRIKDSKRDPSQPNNSNRNELFMLQYSDSSESDSNDVLDGISDGTYSFHSSDEDYG